jgi:hypothetical protein
MSYNYLPIPPRVWSRVQNPCTYTDASNNFDINYNQVYIPLTKQTVTQAQANYEDKLIYKGNILQYKGNSSRLTKSQKYTQLAKGFGPNRTKVFATQSQTYTNPNTTGLRRRNTQTYPYPNSIVGDPNNPSGPFQYNVPNPNGCSGVSIQDGGTLVCGTFANPCTGEIIKQGATSATICNPASASDVPGSSILCWNNNVQTWFPKPRYVMNNSTDKWPVNYKGLDGFSGLVSATRPEAPILTLDVSSNTSVTLSWDASNNDCIPISSYNIYVNGQIYTTVSYTTKIITISGLYCSNSFNVTSISNTTESEKSNTVITNNISFSYTGTPTSVYLSGTYTFTFINNGSITFYCSVGLLNVILVGGGGGGAPGSTSSVDNKGGGGGGGAEVYSFSTSTYTFGTQNNIMVGPGGAGGSPGSPGLTGTETKLILNTTYIAAAGVGALGEPGGNGGGGGGGIPGQDGIVIDGYYGGGGGGNGDDDNSNSANGGGGGGVAYDFTTKVYVSGGTGGKGGTNGTPGGAGPGGQYNGGSGGAKGTSGTNGTYGGGGGGGGGISNSTTGSGGSGGNGFCIISFNYP